MNSKLVKHRLAMSVMVGSVFFFSQGMTGEASELITDIPSNIQLVASEQYYGMAFANMDTSYIYIRSEATYSSEWIGKLYQDNIVEIVEISGDWVKIESGTVIGYVESEYLITGTDAELKSKEIGSAVVTVDTSALNVRTGPGTEYEIVDVIHEGEEYTVSGAVVDNWYPILYGTDIYYISGDYIIEETVYTNAESKEEEEARLEEYNRLVEQAEQEELAAQIAEQVSTVSTSITSYISGSFYLVDGEVTGTSVVEFAMQFIGNDYVWGGTDLMNGADCSGFVQSVFAEFGISLPRTSYEQRTAGVEVESYEDIQVGDIICYDGHVGIYIGNDQIINAIGTNSGIDISSATYKSYITIRRVI